MRKLIGLSFLAFLLFVTFPKTVFAMPAPAALTCESNGGKYEILTVADGSQTGECNYSLGLKCTDDQFYHGNCSSVLVFSILLKLWFITIPVLLAISFAVYGFIDKLRSSSKVHKLNKD